MNGRFSDAVIFNPQGDRINYIKRADGNHDLIINHPEGRVEDPVTPEPLVWNPLFNTLRDDHPKPNVFLSDEGEELAIVYMGRMTSVTGKMEDGLLRLRIKVSGQTNWKKKRGHR